MSIRNSFLALLAAEPTHGYGLKSLFEASTGGVWPLNAGQVYTTLSRLERDGLVTAEGEPDDRRAWHVTDEGRRALSEWYATPVHDQATRDELVIKVLVSLTVPGVDARDVISYLRGGERFYPIATGDSAGR